MKDMPINQTNEMLLEIRAQLEDIKKTSIFEEPTTALVNYIKDPRKNRNYGHRKDSQKEIGELPFPDESRKSVDVFCGACGGHGHPPTGCDYTAKLIKALDYIASLDSANRKTIVDNYNKEQTRRRKWKQLATAGKARQLRDSGDAEGLFELIQDYQSYLDTPLLGVPTDHFHDNDE